MNEPLLIGTVVKIPGDDRPMAVYCVCYMYHKGGRTYLYAVEGSAVWFKLSELTLPR